MAVGVAVGQRRPSQKQKHIGGNKSTKKSARAEIKRLGDI